jgi:thioredoxin 1
VSPVKSKPLPARARNICGLRNEVHLDQQGEYHAHPPFHSRRRTRCRNLAASPALAENAPAFDAKAFAAAQKAGKPILIAVHAPWCPTCKAQAPILSDLRADPKFRDLVYFVIDFDSQKDLLNRFGVRSQSTLIAFKGEKEEARSVGDTKRDSIFAMVGKAI